MPSLFTLQTQKEAVISATKDQIIALSLGLLMTHQNASLSLHVNRNLTWSSSRNGTVLAPTASQRNHFNRHADASIVRLGIEAGLWANSSEAGQIGIKTIEEHVLEDKKKLMQEEIRTASSTLKCFVERFEKLVSNGFDQNFKTSGSWGKADEDELKNALRAIREFRRVEKRIGTDLEPVVLEENAGDVQIEDLKCKWDWGGYNPKKPSRYHSDEGYDQTWGEQVSGVHNRGDPWVTGDQAANADWGQVHSSWNPNEQDGVASGNGGEQSWGCDDEENCVDGGQGDGNWDGPTGWIPAKGGNFESVPQQEFIKAIQADRNEQLFHHLSKEDSRNMLNPEKSGLDNGQRSGPFTTLSLEARLANAIWKFEMYEQRLLNADWEPSQFMRNESTTISNNRRCATVAGLAAAEEELKELRDEVNWKDGGNQGCTGGDDVNYASPGQHCGLWGETKDNVTCPVDSLWKGDYDENPRNQNSTQHCNSWGRYDHGDGPGATNTCDASKDKNWNAPNDNSWGAQNNLAEGSTRMTRHNIPSWTAAKDWIFPPQGYSTGVANDVNIVDLNENRSQATDVEERAIRAIKSLLRLRTKDGAGGVGVETMG